MLYPKYNHNYSFRDFEYIVKGFNKDYSIPLENLVKKTFRVKYACFLDSGRAVISEVLNYLNYPEDSEIMVPVNVCDAVVESIKSNNLKAVTIDINENLTLDTKDIRKKITPNTKAIISVHTFGIVPNSSEILSIAKENKIRVIDDLCQSLPITKNKENEYITDLCGVLSLDITKPISAFGGGVLLTDNKNLFEKVNPQVQENIFQDFRRLLKFIFFPILINSFFYTFVTSKLMENIKELSIYEPSKIKLSRVGISLFYSQLLKVKINYKSRKYNVLNFIKSLKGRCDFFVKTNKLNNSLLFFAIKIKNPRDVSHKLKEKIIHLPRESPLLDNSCPKSKIVYKNLLVLPTYQGIEKINEKICRVIVNEIS